MRLCFRMRVLLDECLPRRLKQAIVGHDVATVSDAGWSGKSNGELPRTLRLSVLPLRRHSPRRREILDPPAIGRRSHSNRRGPPGRLPSRRARPCRLVHRSAPTKARSLCRPARRNSCDARSPTCTIEYQASTGSKGGLCRQSPLIVSPSSGVITVGSSVSGRILPLFSRARTTLSMA